MGNGQWAISNQQSAIPQSGVENCFLHWNCYLYLVLVVSSMSLLGTGATGCRYKYIVPDTRYMYSTVQAACSQKPRARNERRKMTFSLPAKRRQPTWLDFILLLLAQKFFEPSVGTLVRVALLTSTTNWTIGPLGIGFRHVKVSYFQSIINTYLHCW